MKNCFYGFEAAKTPPRQGTISTPKFTTIVRFIFQKKKGLWKLFLAHI